MREIRYICERYNIDETYMLDESNMTVSDKFGNIIKINPAKIYELNLPLFIHYMFEDIYKVIESFNEDISDEEIANIKLEEFK